MLASKTALHAHAGLVDPWHRLGNPGAAHNIMHDHARRTSLCSGSSSASGVAAMPVITARSSPASYQPEQLTGRHQLPVPHAGTLDGILLGGWVLEALSVQNLQYWNSQSSLPRNPCSPHAYEEMSSAAIIPGEPYKST